MKFVTFRTKNNGVRAGWLIGDGVVDMAEASGGALPDNLLAFLQSSGDHLRYIREHLADAEPMYRLGEVELLAPLPRPESFRDFMAFAEHVENAARRHGNPLAPEYYEIPVFYFSNCLTVIGPDAEVAKPKKTGKLDYELEIACVIGKPGKDIPAAEAEEYIFGYMILTDWTARDLQAQEMKVLLGPAKGKDFATSMGPYLVTRDELEPYRLDGERFDLSMTASVNGKVLSKGNFSTITHSFPRMIERASQDVGLIPGEVLGSGTVGTGCLLELGQNVHRFLEPGDVVELEVTGLGKLKNMIT